MSEIQLSGPAPVNKQGIQLEWGVDGWTEGSKFQLIVTSPYNEGIASLDLNQCSMLVAALVEHMKEVEDASQENFN